MRSNTASVWNNVENIPSFVPSPTHVPASSRNRPNCVPTGWDIPAGKHITRPKSVYFQQFGRHASYNHMNRDWDRWGTAVKSSAGCSWQNQSSNMHWGSKNNCGSQQSSGFYYY